MWKESILKLLKLDGLVENLTGYIETRMELMKLEVREEIAKAIAHLSILFFVLAAGSLFILFASVSLALLIGKYVGFFEGFAIVAVFYLLVVIIIVLLRGSVSEALEKKLVEKLRK